MKYLDDKRKGLTGQQTAQQLRPQTTQTVKAETVSAPQKTAAPAVQPAQAQAAPKVMEQHGSAQGQSQTQTPAQPTEAVAQAQQLISQQMQNFRGSNAGAVDDLMAQIQNRGAFEYDVNTDPTYLMLRDIWSQDGKMAMEDTMGQGARLTGGYGNSYAQTAGQQMYQGYMRELNEMVPQLEQAARSDYDAETEVMLRNLALLQQQDEQEYNRYMDFLAQQYQEGRDAVGDQRYDQEWQYQQEQDALAGERYESETAYNRQQDAYDRLLEMIVSTGYKPSAEELAAAGMTEAQAKAWLGYYNANMSGSSSGGGGGGTKRSPSPAPVEDDVGDGDGYTQEESEESQLSFTQMLANAKEAGASPAEIAALIDAMVEDGTIAPGQAAGLKHIWAR